MPLTVLSGTGLIANGRRVQIPGVTVTNPLDAPQFAMSHEDGEDRPADQQITLIVVHTTTGEMPQFLKNGAGPVGDLAERNARYWSTNASVASAHLVVDLDGSVVQIADVVRKITYHAGNPPVNHGSIGIELAIGKDGFLYQKQMEALIATIDALTRLPEVDVPRQYASGRWPIPNVASEFSGIIAHRDVGNRGEGDCGPVPYQFLQAARYDALDVGAGAHLTLWRGRQTLMNTVAAGQGWPQIAVDGRLGKATWALARKVKPPFGHWIVRPGD